MQRKVELKCEVWFRGCARCQGPRTATWPGKRVWRLGSESRLGRAGGENVRESSRYLRSGGSRCTVFAQGRCWCQDRDEPPGARARLSCPHLDTVRGEEAASRALAPSQCWGPSCRVSSTWSRNHDQRKLLSLHGQFLLPVTLGRARFLLSHAFMCS